MPLSKRFPDLSDEVGSASLEFLTAGMLLLVPLVYLLVAVSAIQGASLSVEGAARQAVRVFVQGADVEDARRSAELAVQFALADYGVDPKTATVRISCSPRPGDCLTRRGFVTVTVSASVALPLAPPALGRSGPLSVALAARSTEQVSRFWSAG